MDERAESILAFERMTWPNAGTKAAAIRDVFGVSAVRYFRLLDELIDSPEALRHDPELVYRLRRLRSARVSARTVEFTIPRAR